MTDKAMSPLCPRTIDDMTISKLAPKTQISFPTSYPERDFTRSIRGRPDGWSREASNRHYERPIS